MAVIKIETQPKISNIQERNLSDLSEELQELSQDQSMNIIGGNCAIPGKADFTDLKCQIRFYTNQLAL